jgi:hypothetical protein
MISRYWDIPRVRKQQGGGPTWLRLSAIVAYINRGFRVWCMTFEEAGVDDENIKMCAHCPVEVLGPIPKKD